MIGSEVALTTGLVVGGLGYFALAWYVWRYRGAAGARGLLAILVSVFVWTSGYALEMSSRTVATAEFWSVVKFVGVVAMPPALLSFSLEYTGRRGLGRRAIALLAIEPVLALVSLVVPATRDLIHVYSAADRAATAPLPTAPVPDFGPLFLPHAAYNYGIAFFALGLIVVRLARIGRPYRRQANVVMVAALVPLLANIAYNTGLLGPDALDPVPFLFALLAVVLVWGFFRLRLIDLLPVARDVALEQMADGVLVLDAYDRILDANPAAARLVRRDPRHLVGRYLTDVVPTVAELLPLTGDEQGTVRRDVRFSAAGEATRDLAVTLTDLTSGDRWAGRLVLVQDVTERVEAQRRLADLLAEQTRLASTLQAGLRPQTLPRTDGAEIAVRALPAHPGGQVSGDFYDVHRVLGDRWAFVLGDVSGKGVEAAARTSMARFTVRTLSAEGRAPEQVLEQLNRALLDDESERFCTVVYGRLRALPPGAGPIGDQDGVDGAGGVVVTLVLGGHPCPLVRRRDGLVETVGVPGTALGLVDDVHVQAVDVELRPGDVLVAYTDGVTEARRGDEQFGEKRLEEVLLGAAAGLRGQQGVAAAHLVAEAVADRVVEAVVDWSDRRDDTAVLVLAVPLAVGRPAVRSPDGRPGVQGE